MTLKQVRPHIKFKVNATGETFKFHRMTCCKCKGIIRHLESKQEYTYTIREEAISPVMEVSAVVHVIGFKETLIINIPLRDLIKL